jgi:hypothetical protein
LVPQATQPPQGYPPKSQTAQNENEIGQSGPVGTVQTLPNPIRFIGKADQPCDTAEGSLVRQRKTLSVSVPDGLSVQAESLRSFFWKTSGAPPVDPTYLVLAINGPVRLQTESVPGAGSAGPYALTPNAAAPFRLRQFVDQTRVVIPLHVPGAPGSGEIKIRPLAVGPLKVTAAIIGVTQCGEKSDPAPISFDLTIEPGDPEIVIADRFDLAAPEQIIASPDGKRRIEVFGSRFHLIDSATGALLADDVGEQPRFSPTGRFILVHETNRYAFFDAIDGKLIQEGLEAFRYNLDIVWDDGDSFEVAAPPGELVGGPITIRSLLNENSRILVLSGCTGETKLLRDVAFKVDLENNIAVAVCKKTGQYDGDKKLHSVSLTIPPPPLKTYEDYEKSSLEGLIVPLTTPQHWDMIQGLLITQITDYDAAFNSTRAFYRAEFIGRQALIPNKNCSRRTISLS